MTDTKQLKIEVGRTPYQERLASMTKVGTEYRAYCPWHEQDGKHNPSLSIFKGADGDWAFKCMSQCQDKKGDVIKFVELFDKCSFSEAVKKLGGELTPQAAWTYDATQAAERLRSVEKIYLEKYGIPLKLAQDKGWGVVDHPRTGMSVVMPYNDSVVKLRTLQHTDPTKKWAHAAVGTSSANLLYNVDTITNPVFESDVFVCESERDCLTLEAAGLLALSVSSATTVLDKGELRLNEDHLKALLAFDRIYIATDMDDAGNKCAAALEKVIPSYKYFRLKWDYDKSVGDPKDVGDLYLKHGALFGEHMEALKQEAVQRAKTPKLFQFAQRPCELSNEPIEWIVEGMYPKNGLSLVAGREGLGKGVHALLSIAAILSGGKFLGRATQKAPIVYVDLENPEAVVKDRLRRLGLLDVEGLTVWGQWRPTPPPANFADPIYLECAEKTGCYFFFDSLVDFSEGADENKAAEMNAVMSKARFLSRRCAGVHIQHHTDKYGKSGWRGTTAIPAAADMGFGLSFQGSEDEGAIRMKTIKPKVTGRFHIDYQTDWRGDGLTYSLVTAPSKAESKESTAAEKVRLFAETVTANPNATYRDIETTMGVDKSLIANLAKKASFKKENGVWMMVDDSDLFPNQVN